MEDNKKYIKRLNNIGCDTIIRFSSCTKKWYVSTSAEIVEGIFLTGGHEHQDTIEKAIDSFNSSIEGKELVFKKYTGERVTIAVI